MANYREILRLHSLGISNKQISAACHCSRTTVIDVLKRAGETSLEWGSAKDLSDKEKTDRLFPPGLQKPCYKMPDYSQIHKEMGKNGVTLSLLWAEYCSQCRETGELPYQFVVLPLELIHQRNSGNNCGHWLWPDTSRHPLAVANLPVYCHVQDKG